MAVLLRLTIIQLLVIIVARLFHKNLLMRRADHVSIHHGPNDR